MNHITLLLIGLFSYFLIATVHQINIFKTYPGLTSAQYRRKYKLLEIARIIFRGTALLLIVVNFIYGSKELDLSSPAHRMGFFVIVWIALETANCVLRYNEIRINLLLFRREGHISSVSELQKYLSLCKALWDLNGPRRVVAARYREIFGGISGDPLARKLRDYLDEQMETYLYK